MAERSRTAVAPPAVLSVAIASIRSFSASLRMNVLRTLGSASGTVAEAIGVVILLDTFDGIGGWSTDEVLVLVGVASAGLGLGMLEAEPLEPPAFSQLLRDGRFDQALVRPMSPLLWVVATDVQIRNLGRTVAGVAVAAVGLARADAAPGAHDVALLATAVVADGVVVAAILTIGAAITMWTVEGTEVLNSFTYGGATLAGWPLEIFHSALRAVFLWVVPVGATVYLPTLVALDRDGFGVIDRTLLPAVPLLVGAFCGVAALAWRAGLRRYTGAGG